MSHSSRMGTAAIGLLAFIMGAALLWGKVVILFVGQPHIGVSNIGWSAVIGIVAPIVVVAMVTTMSTLSMTTTTPSTTVVATPTLVATSTLLATRVLLRLIGPAGLMHASSTGIKDSSMFSQLGHVVNKGEGRDWVWCKSRAGSSKRGDMG